MQQRRGGLARDPGVTVGRAGDHTLEESEYAVQLGNRLKRSDQVQFGGAGVGEEHLDSAVDKRPQQCFRAVHTRHPIAGRISSDSILSSHFGPLLLGSGK